MPRAAYYRRVLAAYLGRGASQLSFWHGRPEAEDVGSDPARYFMRFAGKADYAGPFNGQGIPLLDYRGSLGRQYNPVAVAQYGLALWNRHRRAGRPEDLAGCLRAAAWMAEHLEPGGAGPPAWHHAFDWEYFRTLRAPWPSGLAQGQGISLLLRAALAEPSGPYLAAAERAFPAMETAVAAGGLLWTGPGGSAWLEEYLTEPPTHILNGCLWGAWGVYDLARAWEGSVRVDAGTRRRAAALWERLAGTAARWLPRFDTGRWSRYDLAPTRLPNPASPFYHRLHVVQLELMAAMTGRAVFAHTAARWAGYASSRGRRYRALAEKALFKLLYF